MVRLPFDPKELTRRRALADTHNRGALDITEFIIAMHLIQSLMANRIAVVPATLPSDFLAAASAPFEGSVKRSASVSSSGSRRGADVAS